MRSRAIWTTLVLTPACSSTPIPQPPPSNLDFGKVQLPETWPTSTQPLTFTGTEGAAPPNSTLRITNLDTTDSPVDVPVQGDGSFVATVPVEDGHELRFQVKKQDGERLEPIDVVLTLAQGFTPSIRIDCFTVDVEIGFGAVAPGSSAEATLGLANGCAADAQVDASVFRTADPAFAFGAGPPGDVAAGIAVGVPVNFSPSSTGESEEVLLISVQIDGTPARYPVTLFGEGE